MYDVENGLYPEGQYVVGEDIPLGKYLLTSKNGLHGSIAVYESYFMFKEDEPLSFNSFSDDYYMALREKGVFIEVTGANIKRI